VNGCTPVGRSRGGARQAGVNSRRHRAAHAVDGHVEVLVVGTWSTRDGLADHYADLAAALSDTGAVGETIDATIWTRASGFVQW
jgi:hypothetical protein